MISQGARTMTVGQSSFSADASGGRSSVARNSGLRGAKLRPARLYETAVRGERRPRILQSLSRLVESPAYAPRPQSGLGGWAQGRTFLAGGSQPLSLGLFSLEATQLKTVRTGIAASRSEPVRVEIQVLGSVTPRRNRRRPAESIAADTPQCTVTFVISGVAEARGPAAPPSSWRQRNGKPYARLP